MNEQLDLDVLARTTDPHTSHTAAGTVDATANTALFCFCLEILGGTATANEVAGYAIAVGFTRWNQSLHRRAADSLAQRLTVREIREWDSNGRPVFVTKKCDETGREATVLSLTHDGRLAAGLIDAERPPPPKQRRPERPWTYSGPKTVART